MFLPAVNIQYVMKNGAHIQIFTFVR